MGFLDRPTQKSVNPTSKFLEWKSEQQKFSYYDKENKQNVFVDLPLTFLVLEEYHTIKGFSDADQTGIFSNEVLQIGSQEIEVKTFKGRTIAKGIYKEIKTIVNNSGGNYHKSLYVVTKEGELLNISFKGAVVSKWSDFVAKGAFKRLKDEWVTIDSAEEHQKGRVKYSTPNFKFNVSLSDKEFDMVSEVANEFSEYINGYLNKSDEVEDKNSDEVVDADLSELEV
tara:strand:+ start:975 stop:1652 length:678 start_codon:yes stop_codon:yes gene_type:complete